jgi:hypothetical protein
MQIKEENLTDDWDDEFNLINNQHFTTVQCTSLINLKLVTLSIIYIQIKKRIVPDTYNHSIHKTN